MFTFDADRAVLGFAIGLLAAGTFGLLAILGQFSALAPVILRAAAAKWCIYIGLGGTILIWRKSK